jgi:hypothetical protein
MHVDLGKCREGSGGNACPCHCPTRVPWDQPVAFKHHAQAASLPALGAVWTKHSFTGAVNSCPGALVLQQKETQKLHNPTFDSILAVAP